jgi:PBSX family phage portal protein
MSPLCIAAKVWMQKTRQAAGLAVAAENPRLESRLMPGCSSFARFRDDVKALAMPAHTVSCNAVPLLCGQRRCMQTAGLCVRAAYIIDMRQLGNEGDIKRSAVSRRFTALRKICMSNFEAFTFGDPVPVMDRAEILNYAECWSTGKWYEPPVSWSGLAKSFRAGAHHSSALHFKCNVLTSTFIPHKLLSLDTFSRFALDVLVFGNGYLEQRKESGKTIPLKHMLAKYVRRTIDFQSYVQVNSNPRDFAPGSVFHLMEPDINQEVYGLPQYLSALHSAWLNESATLFRRRYFENGSHAGFIMYMTDPAQNESDIDALRKALKESKGPGNFRNLFMYAPNGKKDGLQLIPISEVTAKDEFFNIKNVTRDDVLAAHRVPPQLMGVVPNNTGGFGAADKAAKIFGACEIAPLQAQFTELNRWLGEEVMTFRPYTVDTAELT